MIINVATMIHVDALNK